MLRLSLGSELEAKPGARSSTPSSGVDSAYPLPVPLEELLTLIPYTARRSALPPPLPLDPLALLPRNDMTNTNASISPPSTAKAKKRKRLSSDAGEPSTTEGNGASTSNGKSRDKGECTSSASQSRTATAYAESKSEQPFREEVKEDSENISEKDWRSRAITEAKKMPKEMTKCESLRLNRPFPALSQVK